MTDKKIISFLYRLSEDEKRFLQDKYVLSDTLNRLKIGENIDIIKKCRQRKSKCSQRRISCRKSKCIQRRNRCRKSKKQLPQIQIQKMQ